MTDHRILVVENDPDTLRRIVSLLRTEGWRTTSAANSSEGFYAAVGHLPDLVILDLELPGMDGCQAIGRLREWYEGPIIALSDQGEEESVIRALDQGADDYLQKPFSQGVLLARLRAALRRARRQRQEPVPPTAAYTTGGLTVDFARHQVTVDGKPVHLTQNEFRIVELLAWKPGQVVPYRYLMERIWGPYVPENNKILRVNMAHIRRKLEKDPGKPRYIVTEVGIGYRMQGLTDRPNAKVSASPSPNGRERDDRDIVSHRAKD